MGKARWWLVGGVAVVVCYAGLMAVSAVVWDPMAAVPTMSYPQIVAELGDAGVSVPAAAIGVIAQCTFGIALAVGVAVAGISRWAGLWGASAAMLLVIVLGAPVYFMSGFGLGMDVADTFGTTGGDHTPVGGILYLVSATALATLAALLIARVFTARGDDLPVE